MVTLIIEGPDLAGKSTAIEKISKKFKDGFLLKNLYKPSKIGDQTIYAQYWKIINFVLSNDDVDMFILDRFYPSQAVYSYLRGEDELEGSEIIKLDDYCKDKDFIFVYLSTPLPILEERYLDRGDEHISITDLRMLFERYEKVFENSKLDKIRLYTTEENWLEKLSDFIKTRGKTNGKHN